MALRLSQRSSSRWNWSALRLAPWSIAKQRRFESMPSYQRPNPPQSNTSDKGRPLDGENRLSSSSFYKQFSRPFAKVFLGAMFTYQVLYWSWEKLRTDEIREQKLGELHDLEEEVDKIRVKDKKILDAAKK